MNRPIPFLLYVLSAVTQATSAAPMSDANNLITGTAADDKLVGSSYADELHGGPGNDSLIGGKGADRLYGGRGADRFVIDIDLGEINKIDTVMDYSQTEGDLVVLNIPPLKRKRLRLPTSLDSSHFSVDQRGRVSIQFDKGNKLRVFNIRNSDTVLHVDDKGSSIRLQFRNRF